MADTNDVELLKAQHEKRRRWLWGILVICVVLSGWTFFAGVTYPTRTILTNYRYQQVGVEPDSTWWVLAHRDGKAEILFNRDTARGWQHQALGLDTTQARKMAFWGKYVLLAGDNGEVRILNSAFQPIKLKKYPTDPFDRHFQPSWVAADHVGVRAVVLSTDGQVQYTEDGGMKWWQIKLPKLQLEEELIERAFFDGQDERLYLISRGRYFFHPFSKPPLCNWWFVELPNPSSRPIIYAGLNDSSGLVTLSEDGTWMSRDSAARPLKFTNHLLNVAFLSNYTNAGLGATAEQVFRVKSPRVGLALAATSDSDDNTSRNVVTADVRDKFGEPIDGCTASVTEAQLREQLADALIKRTGTEKQLAAFKYELSIKRKNKSAGKKTTIPIPTRIAALETAIDSMNMNIKSMQIMLKNFKESLRPKPDSNRR